MLFTSEVLAFVEGHVSPTLLAMAVLEVVFPLALVLSSVHMNIDTVTICLIVHPVSLIDIAIDVDELPLTVRSVIFPVAFVACTIRPDLFAESITEASNPLPQVSSSSLERVEFSILPFGIWVVNRLANGFLLFIEGEVAAIRTLGLPDQRNLLPR